MDYDAFLREACGPLDLQWRKYRRKSARRRVVARLGELGLTDFGEYLGVLRRDPEEAAALADRVRVTVSRFLRERERWERLIREAIPVLLAAGAPGRPFRAWSAGCCGGEEPYTLALLWAEEVEPHSPGRGLEILATDIDTASLERARRAVYQAGSLREVPPGMRERHFAPVAAGWRLDPRVAARVRFARHNLREDPPPRGMDLVLCRYLAFTYYQGERRYRAALRLREALRPGGALVIGRKEGLGPRERELLEPWPGADGVFRRPAA